MSFTWHLNKRVGSQNLTSSVIFSNMLSISCHISENLSDPRLFKYTWIRHFMEYQSQQDGQNSWQRRQFMAPKCLILALFSSPEIIFKRNFTTISIIFHKTLAQCILVKFKNFLPYVTQINSENIKTSTLFWRMHYSGPDSPAFTQLDKKTLWHHFPKFKLLIHDTGLTHNMHISYIAM